MKFLNIVLITPILLFVSSSNAWRETNSGSGITEQNLISIPAKLPSLIKPLIMNQSPVLAQELRNFSAYLNLSVVVRIDNQETIDHQAYKIKNEQWWIQTRYLGQYDLDANDELNWSEVIGLYYDMFFATRLSNLTAGQAGKLKSMMQDYFKSTISQQILAISDDFNLQTTSVTQAMGDQQDFLVQIEDSNSISLMDNAHQFSGCSLAPSEVNFQNLRYKTHDVRNASLTVVVGVKMNFTCQGQVLHNEIILQLRAKDKLLTLLDWGRQ